MSFSRQWPVWIALVCLGLTPAVDANCFAADAPPAPAPPATVTLTITLAAVGAPLPAAAPAAAIPPKDESKPAKTTSNDAKPAAERAELAARHAAEAALAEAEARRAIEQAARHPGQAAKHGSLLGAIVEALGGGDLDRDKRRDKAAAAAKAAQEQNIRNLAAQFRPQFQQLLYGELAFLRRACKPDAKSFAEVAKAAAAGLQSPIREFVVARWAPQLGIGRGANASDPRAEMQKLLLPLVKGKLSPEKVQLYLQECDKRTAVRRHAVVMNLVASLDERLVLTAEQRTKLVHSLSANYENSWEHYFEFYGNGGQYSPAIRDASIVPLLSDRQKSVWGQTVKQSAEFVSGQVVQDFLQGGAPEIQEIAHIVEEGQANKVEERPVDGVINNIDADVIIGIDGGAP